MCCPDGPRHRRRPCQHSREVGCVIPPNATAAARPAPAPAPAPPCPFARDGSAEDCRSWLCRPASGGACRRAPDWLDAKIVGVGWKKSGTTSLQAAFQRLHLEPECQCGSLSALSRHKATQDSRFSWNVSLVAAAARKWPGAKFVLTYREPRAWNASVTHWTTVVKPWAAAQYARLMGRGAMPGSAAFLAAYEAHAADVRALFAGSPERLLVLDTDGDRRATMRAFCAFVDPALLARPECAAPFPWRNFNCARRNRRDDATCDENYKSKPPATQL